jgi:hypothetical protein
VPDGSALGGGLVAGVGDELALTHALAAAPTESVAVGLPSAPAAGVAARLDASGSGTPPQATAMTITRRAARIHCDRDARWRAPSACRKGLTSVADARHVSSRSDAADRSWCRLG